MKSTALGVHKENATGLGLQLEMLRGLEKQ